MSKLIDLGAVSEETKGDLPSLSLDDGSKIVCTNTPNTIYRGSTENVNKATANIADACKLIT